MSADASVASPATISLRGLSVYAHHGIGDEERALGQRFEFDVDVEVDDCRACQSDNAQEAIEYEAIAAVIVEVATNFRFRLIEALAEAVSIELLTEFPISSVRIAVHKTAPSMPYPVGRASVVVTRTRAHLPVPTMA